MSVSDVPRSLQSWVSTTHRSYSQLTFFNIFIKNPEHPSIYTNKPQPSPKLNAYNRSSQKTQAHKNGTPTQSTSTHQHKHTYTQSTSIHWHTKTLKHQHINTENTENTINPTKNTNALPHQPDLFPKTCQGGQFFSTRGLHQSHTYNLAEKCYFYRTSIFF